MASAMRSLVRHHGGPDMGGFAQHPRIYDAIASRIVRGLHRRAVADLGLVCWEQDAFVVDLGTGPGRVPLMIAAAVNGVRVEGVDLSPEMIERARELVPSSGVDASRVSFRVADAAALPYPDASVSAIVSTASMHHWGDVGAGIAEIVRVLRPGGQAMIYDPRSSIRAAIPYAEASGLVVRVQALRFGIVRLTLFAAARA